jgi:glycosyltransferase involved in cell wall biosynthesis
LPFTLQKKKPDYVLVHGTHTPFMIAAVLAKIIFRLQIGILLTDQHGNEVKSDGLLGRLSRRIDTLLMSLLLHRFDTYFCLSSTFITKYKLTNALVIPGILSNQFKESVLTNKIDKPADGRFRVVFAGGVTVDNGVDRLIEAVEISSIPNLDVTIYGKGELVQVVKDAASRTQRIAYGGILHGDDLTRALLSADVLINPRPTDNEYAQNSFPSKLIEYLATGVPTLTTSLVSIPEEINDCFFYADGDDAKSLSLALLNLYETSREERLQTGTRAQESVARLYGEEAFGKQVFATLK